MADMKIAIVNDVHIGKALKRNQIVRAAAHRAKETPLPHLLDHIAKQHSPDIIINLGDLIRSESREADLTHYKQAISLFKRAKCPVIHLIGNHDIKCISSQDVESIWSENGFTQKSYGIQELEDITLIWLGMEYNPQNRFKFKLPEDQLIWLKETLQRVKEPTLIFTHCAIDDHELDGNFFYESYKAKDKSGFFLENYHELQHIISKSSTVEMVVQAHLHYFHVKTIRNVPYVTCPGMSDHICGSNISHPEIYSLLTLSDSQLVLKSYSRDFCFAGTEFERK